MTATDDPDEAPPCIEHVWELRGATIDADGAHLNHECPRCGAVTLESPDELAGRVSPRDG